ncbi:hypothetical protein EJ08DRAFT_607112 [Tothia fuscella]|uniref:Uncharacterized protein n=1 Tax=Tothia fuscella TaxID=1048955 RepID=A0A9P4NXJ5_9PEZI|nr:hypothetical protein EJ08DRAFT_607112 [Tothia fuscella]
MASIVQSLRKLWRETNEERIILMGNEGAGKTTLLYRLKMGEIVTTIPTIGFNVEKIQHEGCEYTIWDVGGGDRMQPLYRHYITAETIILYIHNCIDDSERTESSIQALNQNVKQMFEVGAKFIWILLNKEDLIPIGQRASVVNDLRERFEQELFQYNNKIVYQFLDLPGFSAVSGKHVSSLLPIIHHSLKAHRELDGSIQPKTREPVLPHPELSEHSHDALIARAREEGLDEDSVESFWNSFLQCNMAEWNHRCQLRAGYIILLQSLGDGKDVLHAANVFLGHTQKLRNIDPERFRNTVHRTMTIFWLYQLQLAIFNFKGDNDVGEKWPSVEEFQQVLLRSPQLIDGNLWEQNFTKDLFFSPEAREYWRLPDLQALPQMVQGSSLQLQQHIRDYDAKEAYRLMHFAFAVVQKCMSSRLRRGMIIKHALVSLQSTTMRLRANNSSIPPYFETHAYFWIQIIHAALATEHTRLFAMISEQETALGIPLRHLSFSHFRILFELKPNMWEHYYTSKTWESIEARMTFVNPDIKPLPNIISISSPQNSSEATTQQLDNYGLEPAEELPSMEELSFQIAMILEETKDVSRDTRDITSHAQLLLVLYDNVVVNTQDHSLTATAADNTASLIQRLSGPHLTSFTLKTFWTQQVLEAAMHENFSAGEKGYPTFEIFLKRNSHLAYEHLPLCYFSAEVLQSAEAVDAFVAPDKRCMESRFPIIEGRERKEELEEERNAEEDEKREEASEWVIL